MSQRLTQWIWCLFSTFFLFMECLKKRIGNIWSHIPWDLQKIRNLLMPRRSQGIVNPEARTHVRIVCQEGFCCSQLVWHLVHVNSRIVSAQEHGRKRSDCLETENEELSTGPDEGTACNNLFWIWWQWQFLHPNDPNCVRSHAVHPMKSGKVLYEKLIAGWLVSIPHFGHAGKKHFTILMTFEMVRREKRIHG